MRIGWLAVSVDDSYQGGGLERALPVWHHRERHSIHVAAPPGRALSAALAVRAAELPLVRALFRLRGLRPDSGSTLLDAMGKDGFEQFSDGVYVAIGKPWTPRGGLRSAADFVALCRAGLREDGLRSSSGARGKRLATRDRDARLPDGRPLAPALRRLLARRPSVQRSRAPQLARCGPSPRRGLSRAPPLPDGTIEPRRFETCPRDSPWDTSETASTVPGRCACSSPAARSATPAA